MVLAQKKQGIFSGNVLKLIAAAAMFLDHMGMLLFPRVLLFRIIGRIAYPIYAYMIAEGCRCTGNKPRYFLQMFGLGAACQIVYGFFSSDLYLNILLTFSVSIGLICQLQHLQKIRTEKPEQALPQELALAAAVAAVWVLCKYVEFDYGFWGIMTPVLVSLFREKAKTGSKLPVLMIAVGLLMLAINYGDIQYYSLLALPLLYFYSGIRGKLKMKYFFYIFYPAHLALLQGIDMLLS